MELLLCGVEALCRKRVDTVTLATVSFLVLSLNFKTSGGGFSSLSSCLLVVSCWCLCCFSQTLGFPESCFIGSREEFDGAGFVSYVYYLELTAMA